MSFNSLEPRALVSFSGKKNCPLSVVIAVVVNLSQFHLLLKNQWADFNQIWHNASLGEEYSNLLELRG